MEWQPVADLGTGRIVAAEALSRFRDATLGGPAAWFRAAERLGLAAELELCAAQVAVACVDALPEDVLMSINAAPATLLDPRFDAVIAPVLPRLVIEVTERAPVEDSTTLAARLVEWRGEGGRLAIDDTGAGVASLRHILELNPDFIKLDRVLIDTIDRDHRRRALVTALVAFAREIGAGVIAEGVETKAELEALRALGVPFGQGWLLARPQPLEQGDFVKAVAFPLTARPGAPEALEAATAPPPARFLDRVMGVRDAADHVVAVVSATLPDAAVHVAFLDTSRARWRVISSGVRVHWVRLAASRWTRRPARAWPRASCRSSATGWRRIRPQRHSGSSAPPPPRATRAASSSWRRAFRHSACSSRRRLPAP